MPIYSPTDTVKTIVDLGFDKSLVRSTSSSVALGLSPTPELRNSIFEGVAPKNITSGEVVTALESRGGTILSRVTYTILPGQDIQPALDACKVAGGGTIFLANGRHVPTADLTVYSRTTIIGENIAATIIDFEGASFSLKSTGEEPYSTGDVTVSFNSTTVTGNATSWLANVTTDHSILLAGIWYTIASVDSDTQITLAIPYGDITITNVSYVAAKTSNNLFFENFTVQNSATAGLTVRYCEQSYFINVNILTSAVAIDMRDSANITIDNPIYVANFQSCYFNNVHYSEVQTLSVVDSLASDGIIMTTCTNWDFRGSFILNSAGNGVTMTSCADMSIAATNSETNAGHGWELTGCSRIVFTATGGEDNGGDGFKLTANNDVCTINACEATDNTGYGVNIANANDDKNIVTSNNLTGNGTAALNDAGTGTIAANNQT